MDQPAYHVLLEGRKVGPYDSRTILGMRIKRTLTSDHVLIGTDGSQITVGELIRRDTGDSLPAERAASTSLVKASFAAEVSLVERGEFKIPRFRGALEVRVQPDVLRVAGRYREGWGWKDGRVKLPLTGIVHARLRAEVLDLWLRAPGSTQLQRLSLAMESVEAAAGLRSWLPQASNFPSGVPSQTGQALDPGTRTTLWIAAGSAAAVLVVLMLVLLGRR